MPRNIFLIFMFYGKPLMFSGRFLKVCSTFSQRHLPFCQWHLLFSLKCLKIFRIFFTIQPENIIDPRQTMTLTLFPPIFFVWNRLFPRFFFLEQDFVCLWIGVNRKGWLLSCLSQVRGSKLISAVGIPILTN